MNPKTTSILLGGAVGAVLGTVFSLVPGLNYCSCLGLIAAGLFTVWHYTNKDRVTITAGEGVSMGAQSGLVSFLIGTVFLLIMWLFQGMPSLSTYFMEQASKNPQVTPEQMDQISGFFENPLFLVVVVVVAVIVYVVSGLIGGAIGAAVFKKGGAVPPEQTY